MVEDIWRDFVVVGVGGHARTKLIPAIVANGQRVVGLVSGQDPADLPVAPVFPSLADAIAAVDRGTAIVVASPPAAHFDQSMAALAAGFDVIIEKPAFATADQVRAAGECARATRAIVVEAFMHRHTALYSRLLDDRLQLGRALESIQIEFVVPGLPAGTFRADNDVISSVLYDIGCYPLSLLSDLGLPLDELSLVGVESANTDRECLTIAGIVGGVTVEIMCGVAKYYANSVSLGAGGNLLRYTPFFYGRPGVRTLTGDEGDEQMEEGDAFAAMFATPRRDWLATQSDRLLAMETVTAALERLGRDLAAARTGGDLRSCNMRAID